MSDFEKITNETRLLEVDYEPKKSNFMDRVKIFEKINQERDRQDEKFGPDRNQHPAVWNTILSEEVGEFAKEICEADFDPNKLSSNYEKELIQIAAVAVAALENIKMYGITKK